MPERSGHCIQGMRLRRFHCLPHRARRRSRVSICKSGNLLGMWEALPVERNTPNWHRQPVISDMGSRNGIKEKECCLEGNEYTQYTSLSSGFRCCSAGDFWTSYRETFRRRSVRLYTQLLTVLRNTVRGCVFYVYDRIPRLKNQIIMYKTHKKQAKNNSLNNKKV